MRKSKCADLARNGTADQFLQAFKKEIGADGLGFRPSTPTDRVALLMQGAIEAFCEGRPESIQVLFQNLKTIKFGKLFRGNHRYDLFKQALFTLSEKYNDRQAAIPLALAKVPEQDRQEILDSALYDSVRWDFGGESFLALLLQSGADANATVDGSAGSILACAARMRSPGVIKLLHENGASFEDAILALQANKEKWAKKNIDSLRFYQQALEGKPATAQTGDEDIRDILRQIQQQISDLTVKVERLESPAAAQPKKKAEPVKKPRLSLKGLT